MKINGVARLLVLAAVALLAQAVAQAQPVSDRQHLEFDVRNSEFPALHPCGLIREDPRTISWMVQDTAIPPAPRHLAVAADLSNQMPPVGNQGNQGSCTAWAVGYYQKTHYEWIEHQWNDSTTNHQFSPAFIYNQINGGADQGSSTSTAFALITDQGCATLADCPYNQNDYTTWPSESAYARAIPFRGGSPYWFWMQDTTGINKAKRRVDSGYTTVIGIEVYSNFDNIHNYGYKYCVADTYGGDRGGHAITIVGYNDTLSTNDGPGAFRIINSWGTYWGQAGYCWMSYVAARNAALSHQVGYYLDDLTGYSPTMLGRVKITHAARDKIGIRLGVGRPSSPNWQKNFRTWRSPVVDQAFPNHKIVFDMTEGEPYITNNTTDTVFVRAIDDVSDSKTGTINYFSATHLAWNATGVSSDTPVTIPDYNVGVYARARIIHADVGVTQITAPTGTVDSGTVVTPRARVKNFGSSSASFPVTFKIGSFYTNTQNVSNLAAGDSVLVSFTNWTATQRGTHVTRCSTALTGDQNHANDTLPGSVTVRVTNVGVTAIVAPTGTIDSGTVVTPRARVKNYGTGSATFPVTFRVGSFYTNTQTVTNLAPGDSILVSFTNWSALQRGTHVTRCTTALTGDQVPGNNALSGTVTVRVTNVGVAAIVAPTGTVDSGTTVTPQARVKNYGTAAATFPVFFKVGSFYSNSQTVTNLAAGDSALVSFTNWTATQRGTHATRCSTALTGDQVHSNDTLSGTVTVRVLNVGVTRIVAPPDTVDSGTTVTPQARVKNYGTAAATFPVTFRIGSFYNNTQTVTSLAAGDSLLVSFASWNVLQRGTHAKRCSTALSGDQVPANDTLSGLVTVRIPDVTDVGVTVIVAPTGTVDSGATISPQARIKNYGNVTATFPVTFRIGSFYNNSQNVTNLAPGDSALVSFTNWTATQRGTHATRCTTALTNDQNHSNDALSGSVTVRVTNVGVTAIVAPSGTIDSGTVVTPRARVKNYGTGAATFPVFFKIGSFYSNSQTVTNLAAGDSVLVSFTNWTATQRGTHATRCSTALTGDQIPSNDTLSGTVSVRVINVGVTAIVAPTGTIDSGTVVTPRARVKNYGTAAATFPVYFKIGSFYSNSQTVTNLAAGDSALVSFTNWTALQRGTHMTRCSTALSGDQVHANDTLSGTVTVQVLDVGVKMIVAPTGTIDSGTTVTPQARVRNYGTAAATFPVFFKVGSFYSNSQTVTNLAAGDSALVSFTNWTAVQRGTHATRCSTALTSDQNHANDTLSGSVTVRVADVGVTAIVAPTGTVDSGTTITPKARVKNNGTAAATFPVTMRIGAGYNNTQTVTNLAAGDSLLVSFTNWTAAPRGLLSVRCSTNLTGDQYHANDTLAGTVMVRVTDVGATAIVAPTGTIDSGAVVAPKARVKNYGTAAATFPVTFRIGSFYFDTQTVTSLAAGDSVQVSFTNWTVVQRGTHVTRCSTGLSGDQVHGNDTLSGTVTVRVTNVGVTAIVAPTDTVDSGATITPKSRVRNYGTSAATFPVTMKIGTGYNNTQTVTNLAAGDSVQVSFTNWTAAPRGLLAVRCSTDLSGDQYHTDDTLSGSVFVRVANVGVTAIVAPTGTIDSGATVTPQARVRNYGTAAATFPVYFKIGSFYSNSQTVTNLAAGDSVLVSFTNWTATQRGTHATRCSTALSGDQVHSNDTLSGTVTVRVIDVGVTAIVAPTGTVDSGTVVTPRARVKNFGSSSATFPVTFKIGSFYANTQNVSNLAAGDSVLVSFTNWTATQRGTHVTRCTTALTNDQNYANDALSGSVTVRVLNVGATAIVAPTGTVDSGASITPQARVRNYGTSAATFPVTMKIGTGYNNTQTVTNLAAGDSLLVSFTNWTASPRGLLAVRCSTNLTGDQDHSNDTLSGSVFVRVTNVGVATIVAPTGTVDSGVTVTPQARVRNYGTGAATFPAFFRIGSFYSDSLTVANLAAGDSALISFTNWTATQRGTHATRCSTALSGDQNPANDTLSGSVTVRVTNVGVTAIVAPTDTVDSGATVTPKSRVKNYGTSAATFPVTMKIGTGYNNTQTVTNLAAGDSILVSFTNWTAAPRGLLSVRCSTDLSGDQNHANDTLSGSVFVRVTNVGVTTIVAPTGTLDSGTTVTPQTRVKNYGTGTVTFPATFRIGSFYSDTQTVSNLGAGDSALVSFTNWTALQRGTHMTRCSTALSGDQVHSNDTLSGSITVRVTNVGVTAIVAPTGTVDSGATVTPQARAKNFGTEAVSFPAFFKVGSFYSDSQTVTNLAAGDSVLVSFTNWTATQRGTHATRCSTALSGDQVHTNDTLSGTVTVRVLNVGVTAIVAPTGTLDSGTTVTPQARVRNYGTGAATFPVFFKVGSFYSNSQTVSNLAAGDSVLVSFTAWTATQRGTHATRCSTALTGDQIHSNDTLSGSVTVRVTNVGVTAIVAPTGTIDSGTVITPRARVKNYGTGAATFPAFFKIGSFYSDSQSVSNLAAGDSALVSFTNWTAVQRGNHVTRCSTALSGDQNHANDTLSGTVTVRVLNVGVTAIVAPTGTLDSGTTVTPQARVRNYGTGAATFPVYFKIGSFYSNSQTVTNLAAGDSALVSFTSWTATQRGTHVTRCSTALANDQYPANDTLSGTVSVRVLNVGVTAIVAPTGTIDSGTVITPQARVRNYGTDAATFPATFRIGSFYSDSQTVSNLGAGDSALVSFTNWNATQRGAHVTRCSTALANDQNHANDTLSGLVTVRVTDVGVTAIIAPTDTVDSGTTITPQARVRNFGTAAATFPLFFRIGSFYSDSQTVTSLAAGDSALVSFTNWTATQLGTHATRCSTAHTDDQNHANDTLSGSVTVVPPPAVDVGVIAIIAPVGTFDSGAAVTPQARVKNYGTGAASFPVFFKIGSFYSNSQTVSNLGAGDSVLVSFTNWTATQRGTHVTRCSTALAQDENHTNDTLSGSVAVRVTNVGVTAIVAPAGTVDSGATVTPKARVKNYGTSAATFPVTMSIGAGSKLGTVNGGDMTQLSSIGIVSQAGTSSRVPTPRAPASSQFSLPRRTGSSPSAIRLDPDYTDTQTVTNLAPGDSIEVSFTNWTASPRGLLSVRCSTDLTNDQVHANDTLSGTVMVQVLNVGVTAITAPTGTVDSGASLSPQARVRNYGTAAASFPVVFRIGAYADTQNVTNLASGDSIAVNFTTWTATVRGLNATRCSTALAGDNNHANDTLPGTVTVRVRDVACTQLLAPRDTVDSGATVVPQAVVENHGTTQETFDVRFTVGADYADTLSITLAAGETDTLTFAAWTALSPGTFPTLCATMLATDMNPANDATQDSVFVQTYTGVVELQVLPRALALERPAPDPMRGWATIRFSLPRQTRATLTLRSITGALVRTLCNSSLLPAHYSLAWDGRDNSGRTVAPGIYFWRLEAEGKVLTRKAVKLN